MTDLTKGKGRKQCPQCEKYVGVRTHQCDCGHNFPGKDGTPTEPKGIVTYSEPGRGRKQCVECKQYVGAKVGACACGGSGFTKKEPGGPKGVVAHDVGGKGYKECAGCHKFIAILFPQCVCGSTTFVRKAVEPIQREIKVFNEPGTGRKECPKCHKYIGGVCKTCVCGNTEFEKKSAVKTYDEAGPRRKQCPKCSEFVGMNTMECVCGHEWDEVPDEKAKPHNRYANPDRVEIEAYSHAERCPVCRGGNMVILAPRGDSPPLSSYDAASVQKWANKVMAAGHAESKHYSPNALRAFLRSKLGMGTTEYNKAVGHLDNWASSVGENESDKDDELPVDVADFAADMLALAGE